MNNANKSVRHIAYCLCLGINQLIDKGYSESSDNIADKIFNGEMADYILTKYIDKDIKEFDEIKTCEEDLLKLSKLLRPYEAVVKHYKISNNGLNLANCVLAQILFEE